MLHSLCNPHPCSCQILINELRSTPISKGEEIKTGGRREAGEERNEGRGGNKGRKGERMERKGQLTFFT